MKFLLSIIIVTAFASSLWAVDVPELSFKGEELASFSITPSMQDLDLNITVQSEYRNYLDKQSFDVANDTSGEYSTEEPSFVYGFTPLTALASVFVGDKAFRNYLVKKYVTGDYATVVLRYPQYKADLKQPEYQEETAFIYAASLWATNNRDAQAALEASCMTGNIYRNVACDRYTEILWADQDYDALIKVGDGIKRPYPVYTFYAYLLALINTQQYDKALSALNSNPDLVFQYSEFNDLRAISEYYRSNYDAVAKLSRYSSDNVAFITADSMINTGRYEEAQEFIDKIDNEEDKSYLQVKVNIAQKQYTYTAAGFRNIPEEEQRLELLKFYAAKAYPNLDAKFIASFNLTSPEAVDHANFYIGISEFDKKNYKAAADALGKVKTVEPLVSQAQFYRGIALVYVDANAAEADIVNTINNSEDPTQVAASRFMLAQAYFVQGRDGDALQLMDGCTEDYCAQLTADIYAKRGRYDDALKLLEPLNTPQASFSRAGIYYNLMEYNKSIRELDKSGYKSEEAQHLRMKLCFKNGDVKTAKVIIAANKGYQPIVFDGVRELMLAGDYAFALNLLGNGELPDDMLVAKAKLLAWSGKPDEAKEIYNDLLKRNSMIYDSLSGLVALETDPEQEMQMLEDVIARMDSIPAFPQRDLLLNQLALKASRGDNMTLLLRVINLFFPDYANSPYAGDMYAERAQLFYKTGRYDECLQDITSASATNKLLAEELLFLQANCTEGVDMDEALTLYKQMFDEDKQYRLVAAVKLMDLYNTSSDILDITMQVREESQQLYVEGIRRFVETATVDELRMNNELVESLRRDTNKALASAGLFAQARVLNEDGKGRDAARTYMQVYVIDKSDHFTKPGLDAAITIYQELDMTKEEADAVKLRDALGRATESPSRG